MNPSNPESGSSCSPDRYNKEAKAGVLQRKRKHSAITTESSRTPPPSIVITTTRDPIAVCPICNAYPCHHEKDINWTRTRMHDYLQRKFQSAFGVLFGGSSRLLPKWNTMVIVTLPKPTRLRLHNYRPTRLRLHRRGVSESW